MTQGSPRVICADKDTDVGWVRVKWPSTQSHPLRERPKSFQWVVNDRIPGEIRLCSERQSACGDMLHRQGSALCHLLRCSLLTSNRFRPTAGRSLTIGIFHSDSCSEAPIPDSMSSWGLPIAPLDRMTSFRAATTKRGPVLQVETCTPAAIGVELSPPVEKMIFSAVADTATVRFGLRRTASLRYAVADELPTSCTSVRHD